MSNITPTCPTNCGSIVPEVDFNECAKSVRFGEITRVYVMAVNGASLSDFGTAAFFTALLARISNTGVDVNDIRRLDVSADQPAPARDEIILSGNTKYMTPGDFSINVDIDDITLENYDFMRTLQCGFSVKIWYETPEMFFGGDDGIEAQFMLDYVIERGFKTYNKLQGTIKWTAQFAPQAMENLLT